MRLLANENVAGSTVVALRGRGYDVLWVRTDMPGAADDEVLKRADADRRVVVTHDKDFGELAFRWGLPASAGIILLRLSTPDPASSAQRIASVLASREDWNGSFAVVDDERVRVVPLPAQRPSSGA